MLLKARDPDYYYQALPLCVNLHSALQAEIRYTSYPKELRINIRYDKHKDRKECGLRGRMQR